MGILDRIGRLLDDVVLLPEELRSELTGAEQLIEKGEIAAASEKLERVLEARPGLVRGLVLLADARLRAGDVARALAAVRDARGVDREDEELALLHAQVALAGESASEAALAARDAVRGLVHDGGKPLAEALLLRARAELMLGRADRAAREARKALAVDTELPGVAAVLLEALAKTGDVGAALSMLRRTLSQPAVMEAMDPATAERVAFALIDAGAPVGDALRQLLERAMSGGRGAAMAALSSARLAEGHLDEAEELAMRGVAAGGGATALRARAKVALARGQPAIARDALEAAAASSGQAADFAEALRIAPVPRGDLPTSDAGRGADTDALARVAAARLAADPKDAAALGAQSLVLFARGDAAGATPAAESAGPDARDPRLALARARLRFAAGDPAGALPFLDVDHEPDDGAADAILSLRNSVLRALFLRPREDGPAELDLAGSIDAVTSLARDLGAVDDASTGRTLREELDRPLLVAVMGEFNAGKSTFINALVGADVAPTGILPTTATLNVLRDGTDRRVRVVRRDGSTREGDFTALKRILAEAAGEGRAIARVEILAPLDVLRRVWILDTPGMNSMDPEHEALAVRAMDEADAVIWIFDACQAGKDTERRALERLRLSRRPVIPVLNKLDRLDPAGLERVVEETVPELLELCGRTSGAPMVSARLALDARLADDGAKLEKSGWPELLSVLETSVFGRSAELKRRATAGRLSGLVRKLKSVVAERVRTDEQRIAALGGLDPAIERLGSALASRVRLAEKSASVALDDALKSLASELVAAARPRRHALDRNALGPEDVAFLREHVEDVLGRAGASIARELAETTPSALPDLARELRAEGVAVDVAAEWRAAVLSRVGQLTAFQRGVAWTALDQYLAGDLPRSRLAADEVVRRLQRWRADPERELVAPLLEDVSAAVVRRVRAARDEAVTAVRRGMARRTASHERMLEALAGLLDEHRGEA